MRARPAASPPPPPRARPGRLLRAPAPWRSGSAAPLSPSPRLRVAVVTWPARTPRTRGARLLVVPKASVYPDATGGACPTASSTDFQDLQNPGGGSALTVQPATQPDALPGKTATMYLVNAIWSEGSNLVVRAVTTKPNLSLNDPHWVSAGFIETYSLSAAA